MRRIFLKSKFHSILEVDQSSGEKKIDKTEEEDRG